MIAQHPAAIRHRVANDRVKAGHPEAIAVRRLVIARGAWLSPLLATCPLPTLTEWEASCDLVSALNTWLTHENRKVKEQERFHRNGGGRNRSQDLPTLREVQAIRRHGKKAAGRFTRAEPLAMPTVAPAASPAPLATVEAKGWVSLKDTGPRHSTRKTPQARPRLTEEEKAEAVARIAAIAAEKAAKEQEAEAKRAAVEANREARRKETAKAANIAHAKRLAEKRAKDKEYNAQWKAKQRERERARNADARAVKAAEKAARNTPEAISARKAKEYARRRDRHKERMAEDPAYAATRKAKAAAKERERNARQRAARAERAKAKLQEVADGIAAEKRAKRLERSLNAIFEREQKAARAKGENS
jgi:hypothetical protein